MEPHEGGYMDGIVEPEAKVFIWGERVLEGTHQNRALKHVQLVLLAAKVVEKARA